MRSRLTTRSSRSTRAAALVSLAALVLLSGGCGGGSGSPTDEEAARGKLEAGAAKLSAAKSFEVSVLFETEEEGVSEELGCLSMAFDHGKPERFAMTYFDQNCSGGAEAHQVVGIGDRAWVSTEPGRWTAARIGPKMRKELDEEQTDDLGKLFRAADDIEAEDDGGAVEEGDGKFVDVTSYSFKAPASTFSDSGSEVDDVEVELHALLDRQGYLREVVVHGGEDGAGATVTDKFDAIEGDQGIGPPDAAEVHGATRQIRSIAELDALIGAPSD